MFVYELIYYKKILEFNHPTSTILNTKIPPVGKQRCWGTNGYGGCIGYDVSIDVSSLKIFSKNMFLG
jgi:hypothetical protein